MSLIKLALDQQKQSGIAGFTQRHPYLTSGIALTGGLAAADAGLNVFKTLKGTGGSLISGLKQIKGNPGLRNELGHGIKKGLVEGGLYGSILGTVEPAIGRGIFRKPKGEE